MKSLFLVLSIFVASVSWAKIGKPTRKCIEHIEDSCRVSLWKPFKNNIKKCRTVVPGLDYVELRNEKLVLVNTKVCTGSQYSMDFVGVSELAPLHGRLYLVSNNGQAFFMDDSDDFYEILDSKYKSYSSISGVREIAGHGVELVFDSGKTLRLNQADLITKARLNQLKKLYRYNAPNLTALFK